MVVVTVEQYNGNVAGIEVYDVTHAVSGRQKKGSQASTKLQGISPIKATKVSISNFFNIVKSTHQSILPEDVLTHFSEIRNQSRGRLQIKETADGRKYVQADRQVIFGNDPASWGEQVEEYINGKIRKGEDVTLLTEDGDELKLTEETAGKASFPYRPDGTRMSDDEYYLKVNAEAHIDELAQISQRGKKIVVDKDGRHGPFAKDGWNYRTAFFRDFDGKHYRLRISVAQGEDGNVVYNIGGIERRSIPTVDSPSAEGGTH